MFDIGDIKREAKTYYKKHFKSAIILLLIFTVISIFFGDSESNKPINLGLNLKTPSDYMENYNNYRDLKFIDKSKISVGTGGAGYNYSKRHDYGYYVDMSGESVDTSQGNNEFKSLGLFGKCLSLNLFLIVSPIIFYIILCIQIFGRIFIVNPVLVGKNKALVEGLRNPEEDLVINKLFYFFGNENYLKVCGKILLKDVFIFLWSLLLILPGIYKYYQYFFVGYILADNPDMPFNEAINMSKKLTDNYKFNIFLLGLSFIGWYILCFFTLSIGLIFLNPYIEISYATLYKDRLEEYRKKVEVEEEFIGD